MEERSIEYLSKIQLDSLKGFGDKRYSQLKRNNLKSVLDLLRFFQEDFGTDQVLKTSLRLTKTTQNQKLQCLEK